MNTTARYRFEYRLLEWAEQFSRDLYNQRIGFFIGMREDGSIRRIYFNVPGSGFEGDRKAKLVAGYRRWFLYEPHLEPGHGYLEWLGLSQSQAEVWLKRRLDLVDFLDVRSTTARNGWPSDWRVLVG